MSFFVRFSTTKCDGDVIDSASAFGFVMPVTLKGTFRSLQILSDRPITWLSPIMSNLFLLHVGDNDVFVVFLLHFLLCRLLYIPACVLS
jgi:hypothetical protein